MLEFIVIVESEADAEVAAKLAECVLVEKIDWLEDKQLQYLFQWRGLQENTKYSRWDDIVQIIENAKKVLGYKPPRYLGHANSGPLKTDGAGSIKILKLIRHLQKGQSSIRVVFLIRDLDNQPQRRQGITQARSEYNHLKNELEIIIGTADRSREAWVLNGFIPSSQGEIKILEDIKHQLKFDPCEDAHKLRANSFEEPDRIRNPKVVLKKLTAGDRLREQKCWEETDLALLRQRGEKTGLSDYLKEIEERLIPIILE